MLLGSLAFVIAGVVQFEVQAGDKTLKDGQTKLVLFNALPYEAEMSISGGVNNLEVLQNITLPPGGVSMCMFVCVAVSERGRGEDEGWRRESEKSEGGRGERERERLGDFHYIYNS